MIFIEASSSISYQDSFQSNSLFPNLVKLSDESKLITPDYKAFIPAASLRRLGPALRNSFCAASDCQQQINTSFDAIIVGTGLGCLVDTEKFLVTEHTVTGDFLPPTAFIQSTHNTIAGQISLGLANHSYNMTHTQNSLSFEIALIDAQLSIREGKRHVLVGAAEEEIDFLNLLKPAVIQTTERLTSGASFFVMTGNPASGIALADVHVAWKFESVTAELTQYLAEQKIGMDQFSLVLHSGIPELETMPTSMNYVDYSGFYYTNSAFALAMAEAYLKENRSAAPVLIVNNTCAGQLGIQIVARS